MISVPGQTQKYTKDIKSKGWTVPPTSGLKILFAEKIEEDGYYIDKVNFELQKSKPYTTLKDGQTCEFRNLTEYLIGGEKFGIGGYCVKFGNDPGFGKFYYGGMGYFTFLDSDGDGKFETRFSSARVMIVVPERLKKDSNRVPVPPPLKKTN